MLEFGVLAIGVSFLTYALGRGSSRPRPVPAVAPPAPADLKAILAGHESARLYNVNAIIEQANRQLETGELSEAEFDALSNVILDQLQKPVVLK